MSDVIEELERFKANSKLFSLMDEAGTRRLADIARSVEFTPAAEVISEGEIGSSFYLIVTGGVRVTVDSLEGPKEVARLGPGAFFGEMAVLNNEPRTASVMAIGELRCLEFEKDAVLAVLIDYPRVREILGVVGLRRAEALLDIELED
jgi:CRP-like cAMP-binding protein